MSRSYFYDLTCLLVIVAYEASPQLAGQVPQAGVSEQAKVLEEGKKNLAQGNLSQAIAAFIRLKQLTPLQPQAYFFLGVALAESGNMNAAAAELYEATRLGPEQPEHALALANVLSRLGQKGEAIKTLAVFDQKAALVRLSAGNLSELMKLYYGLERTTEALSVLDELSAREPGHPRIDFYRAKIYRIMGDLDLAQHFVEKSLEKTPGNPADLVELGRIYEQRGQTTAAKKAHLEALKQQPNNPETLYALASVCMSLNEIDEAIQYLNRCEALATNLPEIYHVLSQAYQRKGNKQKSAEYVKLLETQKLRQAQGRQEMKEREESMLVTLARGAARQGNASEAGALFHQLLELNPNNREARQYLAEMK